MQKTLRTFSAISREISVSISCTHRTVVVSATSHYNPHFNP